MNRLEKEFQIEELKRYALNAFKSGLGLYCIYNIIMVDESYLAHYPALITILTLILIPILPFTLIRSIYKFFKTLISPAKVRG